MAQYILPENQRLLWDTLHESKLFARVFPQLYDQSAWFQQIVQGIYDQRMGGNPIPLSQAALEKYNRDTMMYMMKDLQQRQAHTVSQHTMIPAADLRKPRGDIEQRLAEHQRDLDHYLGEKRPTEIDFRMVDMVDTPLDTTDIEALLKQQKEQRMTIDNLSPPPLSPPPPPPILKSSMISNTSPPLGSTTHIDDLYKSMEDNRRNIIQIHNDHKDMKTKMDDLYKRLEQLERLSRIFDTDSDSSSKPIDGEDEEYDDDTTIGDTTETSQNGVL